MVEQEVLIMIYGRLSAPSTRGTGGREGFPQPALGSTFSHCHLLPGEASGITTGALYYPAPFCWIVALAQRTILHLPTESLEQPQAFRGPTLAITDLPSSKTVPGSPWPEQRLSGFLHQERYLLAFPGEETVHPHWAFSKQGPFTWRLWGRKFATLILALCFSKWGPTP